MLICDPYWPTNMIKNVRNVITDWYFIRYNCWLTEEAREVPLVWVQILLENNSASFCVKSIKELRLFFFFLMKAYFLHPYYW